MHRPRT